MLLEVSIAVQHTKLAGFTHWESKLVTSLSLSIELSQCNSTGRESGIKNGGQYKREIVVKNIRLISEIKA